jgi:DNA-binding response OmpR family regulator
LYLRNYNKLNKIKWIFNTNLTNLPYNLKVYYNVSYIFAMKLLIIDDNVALSWRLQGYLSKHFEIEVAQAGREGQRLAETGRYDVIILDLGLPDMNGETVCASLRRVGIVVPILILTAEGALESKVRLLEMGADDYLVKPFEPAELRARIKALVRRRQVGRPPTVLKIGDLTINPEERIVERDGTPIVLRRKEFDILEYLARNRGKVITPTMILNHVWDEADRDMWSNTVRVHIKHLRDKIDRPFPTKLIKTAHGVGYKIESS